MVIATATPHPSLPLGHVHRTPGVFIVLAGGVGGWGRVSFKHANTRCTRPITSPSDSSCLAENLERNLSRIPAVCTLIMGQMIGSRCNFFFFCVATHFLRLQQFTRTFNVGTLEFANSCHLDVSSTRPIHRAQTKSTFVGRTHSVPKTHEIR